MEVLDEKTVAVGDGVPLSSETIGNFVLSVTGGIPVTADAPA
jgi:hypothetical protein